MQACIQPEQIFILSFKTYSTCFYINSCAVMHVEIIALSSRYAKILITLLHTLSMCFLLCPTVCNYFSGTKRSTIISMYILSVFNLLTLYGLTSCSFILSVVSWAQYCNLSILPRKILNTLTNTLRVY